MSVPLRAAIYTRVSTDDQASEGHSLPEQNRRGRELVEREGWTYVGTFEDAGISGTLASRPALDRLQAAVAEGTIDVVIVVALDRLARDAGILRDLLRVFDAAGVKVHAAGQALDRKSAEGRLQTGILGEFAEFERAKIAERTKAGIRGFMDQGKPWGRPPFPYRKRADGNWEPNPAEVPIAERIVREYVEGGHSYLAISRRLNADRIPARRGGKWTANVVRRMLLGKAMLGFYQRDGAWVKGQHEAVISEDRWLAAQVIAEQGRKYAPGGGGRTPTSHIFKQGMLRCGNCGEAMLPRSERRGADYYVCRTNKQTGGAGTCPMPTLRRTDVDAEGFRVFSAYRLDFEATRARLLAKVDERIGQMDRMVSDAERELLRARESRKRIERDYIAGDLSATRYERHAESLDDQESAAEAEYARLSAHREQLQPVPAKLDGEVLVRRLEELSLAAGCDVRLATKLAAIDHQVEAEGLVPGDPAALAMAEASQAQARADVGPLRAAIARTFSEVVVTVKDGAIVLNPKPRPAILASADENAERVALDLDANNATITTMTGKLATFHHQ